MKLLQDLREFVELLNSQKVEFLVVGGHAVAFHRHPRYTGDIALFVRPTPENAERVIEALREFGFAELDIGVDDLTRPNSIVQLGRPPSWIDLLTSISGVDFKSAWSSRVPAELDSLPVSFIGLPDLLKNKQAAGRDQDLVDLKKLRA